MKMLEKYPELFEELNLKILNFLSYKARSVKEVSGKLDFYLQKHNEVDTEVRDYFKDFFLNNLHELNLLDDKKYAVDFVREKINSPKPISKLKIQQFLHHKGISSDISKEALKQFSYELELSNAKKDMLKKMKSLHNKPPKELVQKVQAYLATKGYPFEIIRSVVDTISDIK